MRRARKGDTVKVHYKGKLGDGTVFDSSEGSDPLSFTLGSGQLIPGFENAVEGMQPGEAKVAAVPAEKAYGPHREDHKLTVRRADISGGAEPRVGQRLRVPHPKGGGVTVTVVEVTDEEVILDANHPLAGRDLVFEIQLVEIC